MDYYVAADDVPGHDTGAGYVNEAIYASACFYKYFSIHWPTLVKNLGGFPGNREKVGSSHSGVRSFAGLRLSILRVSKTASLRTILQTES